MSDADPMSEAPQRLTPELMQRAGVALYGEHWQMPLARLLGVSDRTVRRIAQAARMGEPYRIHQSWAPAIKAALQPIPREREVQARFAEEVLEALRDVG